jgi:hypothetical protein
MTSSNPPTNSPTRRNRRDVRPVMPRRMRETPRDLEIVRLVYDYRILSQQQLERLLGKARSTVQQALVRLYHHRYLERVFLPVSSFGSPTLYILDKRGIELLQRQGQESFVGLPDKRLSAMFLQHSIAINTFRIELTMACQRLGWQVKQWLTENEIKADYDRLQIRDVRGRMQRFPVVPDSYFVIEIPGRGQSHFFVEVDRGTMQLERFKTKVATYVSYYKQGLYEKRYAAKGFRVLTIVDTPGKNRLKHLTNVTIAVEGVGRRFWFAHLSEITVTDILTEAIWSVAGNTTAEALFNLS